MNLANNNLEVAIPASRLDDVLKKVPASFTNVAIEFGAEDNPKLIRIRVKSTESSKSFFLTKEIEEMDVISSGILLTETVLMRKVLSIFGDNLRIVWRPDRPIILKDDIETFEVIATNPDNIVMVELSKVFPYKDGRVKYPMRENGKILKDDGKIVMGVTDSCAIIPLDEFSKALKRADLAGHEYISLHLHDGDTQSSSGKYDVKSNRSNRNMSGVTVIGDGEVDLGKSLDEFTKIAGSDISIHFNNEPVVTMVSESENELCMYTLLKMQRPKPGE